jgi:hypothetical protein
MPEPVYADNHYGSEYRSAPQTVYDDPRMVVVRPIDRDNYVYGQRRQVPWNAGHRRYDQRDGWDHGPSGQRFSDDYQARLRQSEARSAARQPNGQYRDDLQPTGDHYSSRYRENLGRSESRHDRDHRGYRSSDLFRDSGHGDTRAERKEDRYERARERGDRARQRNN